MKDIERLVNELYQMKKVKCPMHCDGCEMENRYGEDYNICELINELKIAVNDK